MRSNTYKEEKAWKEIQSYLPEENRLNDDTILEEMYMKIEECEVHIDRKLHYVFDTGGSGIMARARFSGKKARSSLLRNSIY